MNNISIQEFVIPSINIHSLSPTRGQYIGLEGIDGSGKTTLASDIVQHLNNIDVPTVLVSEPCFIDHEDMKDVLGNPNTPRYLKDELYSFLHKKLYNKVIKKLLKCGVNVVSDRTIISNFAYGNYDDSDISQLAEGYKKSLPDQVYYIDCSLDIAEKRRLSRNKGESVEETEINYKRVINMYGVCYKVIGGVMIDNSCDYSLARSRIIKLIMKGLYGV